MCRRERQRPRMRVTTLHYLYWNFACLSFKAAKWSITLSLKSAMFLTISLSNEEHGQCIAQERLDSLQHWETLLSSSRCNGNGNKNVQKRNSFRKCLLGVVSLQNLVLCQSTTAALEFWILKDERQFSPELSLVQHGICPYSGIQSLNRKCMAVLLKHLCL